MFDLPLPFCHAVYQDRLRKDVKKIIAVATVPFLSLISFQRCLSSAECRGPRSCRCLPPSVSLRLQDVDTGVGAGIWGRQMVKQNKKNPTPVNRTVSTDLCAGRGRRGARMYPQCRCVCSCRCSEGCLLLYSPTAIGHESTASRDTSAYMVG